MSEHENFSAGTEARRSVPGEAWSPEESHRQELLLRYLGAVAGASAAGAARPNRSAAAAAPDEPDEEGPAPVLRVRDVMDVPAFSVRADLPFLDLARTLGREHVGALPVVDAQDRVLGVVSESDLLAKAAVEAIEHRPGPIGRLRERRLFDKARAETAGTLMTTPAVTARPGMTVADAARVTARERLKRLPVTDWSGRLVGVVRRNALLQALVRDDEQIREEIESRIILRDLRLPQGSIAVTVRNGVVDLTGRMDRAVIPRLLEEVWEIHDVTEVLDHVRAA